MKRKFSTQIARSVAGLIILLLALGNDLWATAIYTCVIDGVTTYSDRPCNEMGKLIIHTADGVELQASGTSPFLDWSWRAIHTVGGFLGRNWYLILIVIAVLVALLKTPRVKGMLGEGVVNLMAKVILNKDDYHLIKNVTLPTKEGTTQIDHVIVSNYGVFVIETKNMKGWIFGNPNQKTWTQKIYKHTNTFQNPLHQNEKHIKALVDSFSIRRDQIYSVVAFVGNSTFKTPMPENVTKGRGWIRFIKTQKRPLFSDEDVARLIRDIEATRLVRSVKTNREHIQHVRTLVASKQKKSR